MHIGIGAAILILGVLFLATSKAGLKVLGVLTLVAVLGGGAVLYADIQQGKIDAAAYEAAHPKAEYEALKRDCAAIGRGALDGLRLQLEFERRGCPTYLQHD